MSTAKCEQRWLDRLCPLPKQIAVESVKSISARGVSLTLPRQSDAVLPLAEQLLRPLTAATDGEFEIRLALLPDVSAELSDTVSAQLRGAGNRDQAYAVEPLRRDGQTVGLLAVAETAVGLLYAARTLSQLIPSPCSTDEAIEMPIVTIVDWPDIGERGEWGGNSFSDTEWMSQWKLNVVEAGSGVRLDGQGGVAVKISQQRIDEARARGVKIVPFVIHLEQVARSAGLLDRTDIISTPDPDKPLPSQYIPGLCMSSPATQQLVGRWLAKIAELDNVTDIQVWLSEGSAPCFCPKCHGQEPFQLEVACILKAFEQAKAVNPDVRLRILLTQGSYPVNDKVIAAVPEDVGVTYYDGGRTYDSSHAPMIYPLMEDFSRSGRWLGVYPQIIHSWRTVFPWIAPQFVNARATEFAEKELDCMIGYALPSNSHSEFNVMAMAEWTWNANGRSPQDFARVYATLSGICDPDVFARWAMAVGDAGWWFAESRLLLFAIYDPKGILDPPDPDDHRFEQAGLLFTQEQIVSSLAQACDALKLAYKANVANMIDETESLCAGLSSLLTVDTVREILGAGEPNDADKERLTDALDNLIHCAAVICTHVPRWANRVKQVAEPHRAVRCDTRMRDTANVMLRVWDALRDQTSEFAVRHGALEYQMHTLCSWSAEDFDEQHIARFEFDISDMVESTGGTYFVGLTFGGGDFAATADDVSVSVVSDDGSRKRVCEMTEVKPTVGRYEPWHDVPVVIPSDNAGEKLLLEIAIKADVYGSFKSDGWECSGSLGLRRGWDEPVRYLSRTSQPQ